MNKRKLLISARLFFGLLAMVTLIISFSNTLTLGYSVIFWFSFFTTLSNLFSAFVLLVSAYYLMVRKQPSESDDIIRGSAVVAIAIVGIVFGLLLSGMERTTSDFVNFITHYLMPVIMVVDWLVQPPKVRLLPRHIWYWLIFPFAYLIYSLIRGSYTHFYPYWFMNPREAPVGWNGVAGFCGAILIGFLVVSYILLRLGNKLKRSVV